MLRTSKLFRIQYVSDLHLECYSYAVFPLLVKPTARYLALAGDIGQPGQKIYRSFFDYVARYWDEVFYVAGEQEYGNKAIEETHDEIHDIVKPYGNVHFLHHGNPSHYLKKENVAMVGSTLRSPASKKSTNSLVHALQNEKEVSMMDSHINYWTARHADICMLTHAMPIQNKDDTEYNLLCNAPVRAWIYGKDHAACTFQQNRAIVSVNARGYPGEPVAGFSPHCWLEFPKRNEGTGGAGGDGADPELAAAAAGIFAPTSQLK